MVLINLVLGIICAALAAGLASLVTAAFDIHGFWYAVDLIVAGFVGFITGMGITR